MATGPAPRIPSAQGFRVQRRSVAAPQVPLSQASPAAHGAGIAAGITALGGSLSRIGARQADIEAQIERDVAAAVAQEKKDADKRAARNAAGQYSTDLKLSFGRDVASRLGDNALPGVDSDGDAVLGVTAGADRFSKEHRAELAATLPNDESRLMFGAMTIDDTTSYIGRAVDHQSTQSRAAQVDSFSTAQSKLEADAASGGYNRIELAGLVGDEAEHFGTQGSENEEFLRRQTELNEIVQDNVIARDIRTDPAGAFLRLNDGTYGIDDEGKKTGFIDDSLKRLEQAYDDLKDAGLLFDHEAGPAQDEAELDTVEEGDKRAVEGTLSMDWLNEFSSTIPARERTRLVAHMAGKVPKTLSPRVYENLEEQVDGIVDDVEVAQIRRDISRAVADQEITVGQGNQLRAWIKDNQFAVGGDRIRALKPSDLNPDPFAPARFSQAIKAWGLWKRRNRDATPAQATEEAERIIVAADVFGMRLMNSTLANAMPRFSDSAITDNTKQNARLIKKKTGTFFMEKHEGNSLNAFADPAYKEEMRLIDLLVKLQTEAAAAALTKPAKAK